MRTWTFEHMQHCMAVKDDSSAASYRAGGLAPSERGFGNAQQ